MAVNRIILRDGKKVCIPIKTRAEYYKLRDADFNRKSAEKARKGEMLKDKDGNEKSYKTRLEQFNYSCIPNEDGTLRGAVQPANSVGMDVDFNEAEIGNIPEIVERILAKKDDVVTASWTASVRSFNTHDGKTAYAQSLNGWRIEKE